MNRDAGTQTKTYWKVNMVFVWFGGFFPFQFVLVRRVRSPVASTFTLRFAITLSPYFRQRHPESGGDNSDGIVSKVPHCYKTRQTAVTEWQVVFLNQIVITTIEFTKCWSLIETFETLVPSTCLSALIHKLVMCRKSSCVSNNSPHASGNEMLLLNLWSVVWNLQSASFRRFLF